MPIYDYECKSCGFEWENLTMPGDIVDCPECESLDFRILIKAAPRKTTLGDNSYPYVEENLGPEPILLEGPAHRARIMKERGLVDRGVRKGHSGQWV